MAGAGYKLFNTGDVLTAQQVNEYLQQQTVMVFANATARTTALSGVLAEGMVSYLKDQDKMYVYDGSSWVDASSELPSQTGNSGKYLTTNGSVASWATVSSGGMTLIQEITLSASTGTAFSSIPGTYKHLLLTWDAIYASATSNQLGLRFNNDSGAGKYTNAGISALGPTVQVNYAGTQTSAGTMTTVVAVPFGKDSNASSFGSRGSLWIYEYASTTKNKRFDLVYGYYDYTAGDAIWVDCRGTYSSTSAITSLDLVRLSGTGNFTSATNTSLRLYGVS